MFCIARSGKRVAILCCCCFPFRGRKTKLYLFNVHDHVSDWSSSTLCLVCYTWELTHGAQLSFEIETIFNVLNSSITDVKRNGALIDFRTAHRCTLHDACLSAITSDSIVHGHMPYFIKEFFRATRRRHTLRCTPLTISVLCVHSVSRFQKHYCSI